MAAILFCDVVVYLKLGNNPSPRGSGLGNSMTRVCLTSNAGWEAQPLIVKLFLSVTGTHLYSFMERALARRNWTQRECIQNLNGTSVSVHRNRIEANFLQVTTV